jgi:hypothetical protein
MNSQIIDDNYLLQELRLTPAFISKHASHMGAFSRPRRYFIENVFSHLHGLAEQKIKKSGSKALRKEIDKRTVLRLVDETFRAHGIKTKRRAV